MQVPSVPQNETDLPDAPLTLGIVGCSLARPRYGTAILLQPRVKVTALADPDIRFARAWGRSIGGEIELFPDLATLIAGEDSPQALIVDVPLSDRPAALHAAIPVCRAILCAPPFAPTLEETDRILHDAAAHGTWLLPSFPRRFDPTLGHAIELANSGEIGLLQQVRCDWSFPLSRAYGAEVGADPDAGTWNSLLQYVGCHATDVCRWCFGDVLTVSADVDSVRPEEVPAASRNSVPLLANFVLGQENGPATCHFARSRAVTPSERYTFCGSLGNLELVFASSANASVTYPTLVHQRPGQRPSTVSLPEFPGCELPAATFRMRAMLDDLADRALSGEPPNGSGDAARAALEVVHAAYQSAKEGRKVTLPMRRSPAGLI